MTGPESTQGAAAEARQGWRSEAREILSPGQRDPLLALVMGTGVVTAAGIAWRAALAFDGPSTGAIGVLAGALLAVGGLVGALVGTVRITRRRIAREVRQVYQRAGQLRCPRCAAALEDASEAHRCGGCGARLRCAEGLVIVGSPDPARRRSRWRAAAGHRLRHVRPTVALAPPLWLAAVGLTLALIVAGAHALGGAAGVVAPAEASAGQARETPDDGVARARGVSVSADVPVGAPTRPRAPLHLGTQVLARMGRGPYYEFAVIVRVEDHRGFVVYADGDSAWVDAGGVLAPELASGDDVEVFDGVGFVPAVVRARVGSALLVDGWTSVSRVRLRLDAAHTANAGRGSSVPAEAWVEALVDGAWRPGISVDSAGLRQRVVLGDGREVSLGHRSVRAQQLGPGARVLVDGRDAEQIIAARIGHALAIVGPDGTPGWTSLSRVRRP